MRKRSGLTILEALIVAFLLSLILGATAFTIRGYAQTTVQSNKKDRVMAGATAALEVIRSDVAAAVDMSVDTSNPRVSISRVDPARTNRVDSTLSPLTWDAFDAANLAQIRYRRVDEELIREVTPAGGTAASQVLAGDISEFQCVNLGRGRFDVTLSFEEASKQTDIQSVVLRRLRQEPKL